MKIKRQYDIKDCGLCVLQAFYQFHYHQWLDLNELKYQVNYTENGINLHDLIILAKKFGLFLNASQGDFEAFKNLELVKPVITIIKEDNYFHYVIIEKKDRDFVFINDSFKGKYQLSLVDFESIYLDLLIFVDCDPKHQIIKARKPAHFKHLESQLGRLLLIAFLSILLQAFIFGSSYFFKYIVDDVISIKKHSNLLNITVLFLWIGIVRIINEFIINLIKQKIYLKIEEQISNLFFNKVINGKIKQLNKITKTDYLQRLSSLPNVASWYCNIFLLIFNNILIILVSFISLIFLSWKLTALAIVVVAIQFIGATSFKKFISAKKPKIIEDNINMFNSNIEVFYSLEGYKNSLARTYARTNFLVAFKNYQKNSHALFKVFNLKSLFLNMLVMFGSILITYFGTIYILDNAISLGILILFNTILSFTTSPLETISDLVVNWNSNKIDIERIDFILNLPEEKNKDKEKLSNQLRCINIQDLSFSFAQKDVIKNLNLIINKHTQITGKNGVGKSTLAKLLFGLYDDYSGAIYFNDKELSKFDKENLRSLIFLNDNFSYFASDFLINVVTLRNKDAIFRLKNNIEKYDLNSLLQDFNLSWNAKIENGGMFLSTGQRQLLNLLKLFCFEYNLIILDEAFENISSTHFLKLTSAIKKVQRHAIFIEISHNNKTIFSNNKIALE
ncbi:cobalt ABC transporter ATPase component [Metamycoplasma arthritidis]|uniref:Mbov_0121 family peptidase domain-containing ABC transporter n=1 Tax=Metamycoplasma arthritidis TaxID=2111 RepID=UPI0010050B93|nr:cysteine peptidase family C39 domain-containing protein [Metamycoplasma arthritidis]VEU78940.1 cobalt ABC transporter ATPase component [Metamycoplasma arthritidis]